MGRSELGATDRSFHALASPGYAIRDFAFANLTYALRTVRHDGRRTNETSVDCDTNCKQYLEKAARANPIRRDDANLDNHGCASCGSSRLATTLESITTKRQSWLPRTTPPQAKAEKRQAWTDGGSAIYGDSDLSSGYTYGAQKVLPVIPFPRLSAIKRQIIRPMGSGTSTHKSRILAWTIPVGISGLSFMGGMLTDKEKEESRNEAKADDRADYDGSRAGKASCSSSLTISMEK
ncbi:hypothetical protein LTR66_015621 [Elasticomyces elasticus]|nr:hypothetical protein LTR66_015621 [Elasticomyces elasticus]